MSHGRHQRFTRRRRGGISLLDTTLSVAIVVVMSFMSLAAMRNAVEMREILEERDETTRAARVAMSKIRRELQLAFLTQHRTAVEQYETVFVGLDESPDTLFFASLAHQRLYRDTRECDQTEITLWAEPAGRNGRGYVLYHREAPRIDEEPAEGGKVLPLAHNVRSFEVRYLDSTVDEWRDEWDTRGADTPYRLPRAVQIGLVLIGTDPEDADRTIDLPFLTTVMLEYGPPYRAGVGALLAEPSAAGGAGGAGGRGAGGRGGAAGSGRGGRPTLPAGVPMAPGSGRGTRGGGRR